MGETDLLALLGDIDWFSVRLEPNGAFSKAEPLHVQMREALALRHVHL